MDMPHTSKYNKINYGLPDYVLLVKINYRFVRVRNKEEIKPEASSSHKVERTETKIYRCKKRIHYK